MHLCTGPDGFRTLFALPLSLPSGSVFGTDHICIAWLSFLHCFRLASDWWQSWRSLISRAAPVPTLTPFCPTMLSSPAGPSFPSVLRKTLGLRSVPTIPALLKATLRPVGPLGLKQGNPVRGGDEEEPVPGQADSWMSPQKLPGLSSLCAQPACIHHGWVLIPGVGARDCGLSPG